MMRPRHLFAFLLTAGLASAADVAYLGFDFPHGTIVNNQYAGLGNGPLDYGITIAASGGPDIAITYDSELAEDLGLANSIDGADADLERKVIAGSGGDTNANGWDGGNLGPDHNAGGLLIVQENNAGSTAPTYGPNGEIVSASNYDPDDRATGTSVLTFTINNSKNYNYFTLVLADLEESADSWEVTLTGFDANNQISASSPVDSFLLGDLIDLDGSIKQGNNFINRLPETSILNPAVTRIAQLDIDFGSSSGAIDQIIFSEVPIPEPSTVSLGALSALFLLRRRRRRS